MALKERIIKRYRNFLFCRRMRKIVSQYEKEHRAELKSIPLYLEWSECYLIYLDKYKTAVKGGKMALK